jgi:hypothetical protein
VSFTLSGTSDNGAEFLDLYFQPTTGACAATTDAEKSQTDAGALSGTGAFESAINGGTVGQGPFTESTDHFFDVPRVYRLCAYLTPDTNPAGNDAGTPDATATLLLTIEAHATPPPSHSGPSGNRAAIGFYRIVQRAMDAQRALRYSDTGYAWILEDLSAGSFHVRWGRPAFAGSVPAREQVTATLRHGRVAWVRDDLTPTGRSSTGRKQYPLEVIADSAGIFWRFRLPGKTFACYGTYSGQTGFWSVGSAPVGLFGHFHALRMQGRNVLATSSFPYDASQTETETDTINPHNHLLIASRFRVSRGTATEPAFTYSSSWSYPGHALPLPAIKLCG